VNVRILNDKDMKVTMTHSDYFAGIGGFSLAAEWLGIETVYTCENNEFRHNWLKYRFRDATHEKDITKTDGYPADIFTGGFPCQDVSAANPFGKGIDGGRSGLWNELYRIVAKHRPRYLLLENSPRLVHRGLRTILRQIAAIGYDAEWNVFSKRTLGFPDIRKRLFLVAYPSEIGCYPNNKVFNKKYFDNSKSALFQNMVCNQSYGTNCLEIQREAITKLIQDDTGIPEELVKNEIEAYGDAVCPHVAFVVMHMIVQYENRISNQIN